MLDEAMGDLSDDDRDAVALRFFEGRAFADIGRALRLTEEAARKRVDRALDKMGAALSRRGVTSTSAALGVALAQQATCAAPAGLAASVAGSALAGATAAGGVAAGAAVVAFMSSMKATVGVGVVAALAIGGAIYEMKTARARDVEIAALTQQRQTIQANLADVQQRLQAAEKRAAAAEDDNAKLLTAIRNQSAARTAAVTQGVARPEERQPITRDAVEARYRRAQELAKTGDPALALEELLWCFDEGMVGVTGYGGVRMSFLLSHIAKLGERHPPALAALRERRDKAEKRVWVSENDYDAASTFGAINRVLNEPERTLAILDQLPAGDRRRRTLASSAADHLVEAKRYGDAMEGRPYDGMVRLFESQQRPNLPPDRVESVVAFGAKNVEILAGAGDVGRAREFAEKILAFDASPETRALLEKHAARAGQPELLRGR